MLRGDAERLLVALDTGKSDPARAGRSVPAGAGLPRPGGADVERLFGRRSPPRSAELPVGRWSGPVESGYGLHLVLVHERTPARLPDLDEVRDAVANGRAAAPEEANRAFYEGLRARYEVTVERPAGPASARPRDRGASVMMRALGLLAILLGLGLGAGAQAHEVRPGYLELRRPAPRPTTCSGRCRRGRRPAARHRAAWPELPDVEETRRAGSLRAGLPRALERSAAPAG